MPGPGARPKGRTSRADPRDVRGTRRAAFAAFFLSGFAGLMHQVVWARLLLHLLGATAYAQATVLAVFMGGLAIGAVVIGRRVDARGRPLCPDELIRRAGCG